MHKRTVLPLTLIVLLSLVLSGCGAAETQAPEPAGTPTTPATQPATALPAETEAPTPEPEPIPCNIAFDSDRDGSREIYSMAPDGSNQVNLTNNPADDFDPVWSPDGKQIAFVSNRETGAGGGQFIYTMQADGSEVTRVSTQADSKSPDWSPLGSQIAYSSMGEIYLVDMLAGTEVNLTSSPEPDEQPKFSPDGKQIAWLKGDENNRQLFVMNLDGSNGYQVTQGGKVNDAEWTVDGRIFTHWDQPDGICSNCVVTADGKEVIDAGGKGTIQEFLPFWTEKGERVELISADINNNGFEDIILVGEVFPDIFKYLTSNQGNNRNPDAPSMCGPVSPASAGVVAEKTAASGQGFVIGYTGSISPNDQLGFDTACSEIDVECVHGDSISELADKGVDAIVNGSNRWDAMGAFPQIRDAVNGGIPIFMLNAETTVPGAFNLSAENEIITTTLTWMFKTMNDAGGFAYYNYGSSDYIQQLVDAMLKGYPGITAIKNTPDYGVNPFSGQQIQDLIAQNASLGAIWSSEPSNDLFWAAVDKANSRIPLLECPAREDMLTTWKNELDAGSTLQCVSFIRPGGTAYEGIYAAYYYLSGYTFKPDMLGGEGNNTLKYDIPMITNETLPEWLNKLDSFRVGDNEMLFLQPKTPEEILDTWFVK